jgi:hypothetical protein
VDSFINEARSYCALVESDEKVNSWTFAQDCLMSILRLYERALLLPAFEPATDSVTDTITYEILGDMKTRISEKLSATSIGRFLNRSNRDFQNQRWDLCQMISPIYGTK